MLYRVNPPAASQCGANLKPRWDKLLNVCCDYVKVGCVPSVARAPCIRVHQSQNTITGVTLLPYFLKSFFCGGDTSAKLIEQSSDSKEEEEEEEENRSRRRRRRRRRRSRRADLVIINLIIISEKTSSFQKLCGRSLDNVSVKFRKSINIFLDFFLLTPPTKMEQTMFRNVGADAGDSPKRKNPTHGNLISCRK
jgi:hypothetical protein